MLCDVYVLFMPCMLVRRQLATALSSTANAVKILHYAHDLKHHVLFLGSLHSQTS